MDHYAETDGADAVVLSLRAVLLPFLSATSIASKELVTGRYDFGNVGTRLSVVTRSRFARFLSAALMIGPCGAVNNN